MVTREVHVTVQRTDRFSRTKIIDLTAPLIYSRQISRAYELKRPMLK